MRVQVLYFGVLKDLTGTTSEPVEVNPGATVADLLRLMEEREPRMAGYRQSIAVSVNREYATAQHVLQDEDEVGLLPPVSGGLESTNADRAKIRAFLVRERIDAEKITAGVKCPADGAIVSFDGVVRDNSRGRRTVYLDYEAYEEMAQKELAGLVEQATRKFEIRDAVIVHRLGRLYVGETSVFIVVAAAHRGAAFDACRWVIDTLKKTVPIWKKEYFEDGAVWADGEPFPTDIGVQK